MKQTNLACDDYKVHTLHQGAILTGRVQSRADVCVPDRRPHNRVVRSHTKTLHALDYYSHQLSLGSATLSQLAFLGGKRPEFPIEKHSYWDNKIEV